MISDAAISIISPDHTEAVLMRNASSPTATIGIFQSFNITSEATIRILSSRKRLKNEQIGNRKIDEVPNIN